jgi:hypothetical protein
MFKVRSSRKLGIQLKNLKVNDKSLLYKHASLQLFHIQLRVPWCCHKSRAPIKPELYLARSGKVNNGRYIYHPLKVNSGVQTEKAD